MSEIFAAQLSAVATMALAILALGTAVFAGLAFGTQYRQLREQLRESNRQALERRRAQASQVFMWGAWEKGRVVFHVRNTSRQPVYRLQLEWDLPLPDLDRSGLEWRDEPLMPGEEYASTRASPVADILAPGISATFRDCAGIWWRIRTNGQLEEEHGADGAATTETAP